MAVKSFFTGYLIATLCSPIFAAVIYVPPADNSSYLPLEHYLCGPQGRLSSATTIILSAGISHVINPGPFCLVESISELTVTGGSTSEPAEIRCDSDARGFGFFNVSNLVLSNLRIVNCGGTVTREAVRFANDSLLFYGEGQRGVFLFNHCFDLLLHNIDIQSYQGYAVVGVNILGTSQFDHLSITENTPMTCSPANFSCAGSGVYLYWQESDMLTEFIVEEANLTISDATFRDNDNQLPESSNHIYLRKELEHSHASSDLQIIGGSGLTVALTQTSYNAQISVVRANFTENSGTSFGVVFLLFLNTPSTGFINFHTCAFFNNSISYFREKEGHDVNIYIKQSGLLQQNSTNTPSFPVTIQNSTFFSPRPTPPRFVLPTACIFVASFPQEGHEDFTIFLDQLNFNAVTGLVYATTLPQEMENRYLHVTMRDIIARDALSRGEPGHPPNYGVFEFRSVGSASLTGTTAFSTALTDCAGPVLYMYDTDLHIGGFLEIARGDGPNGGAMILEAGAKLVLHEPLEAVFRENHGVHGGAVYSIQTGAKLCAIQYVTKRVYTAENISGIDINITLVNNRANLAGNSFFIYPLYYCDLNLDSNIHMDTRLNGSTTALIYQTILHSSRALDQEISSLPTQLCTCNFTTQEVEQCNFLSIYSTPVATYPGQTFTLELSAIDDNDTPVYTQLVTQVIEKNQGPNGWTLAREQQNIEISGERCNLVNYTVYTTAPYPTASPELAIISISYASIGALSIHVMDMQRCPPGFREKEDGACHCISLLTDLGVQCDINTLKVTRHSNSWIGVTDRNDSATGREALGSEIAFASICPFGYCNISTRDTNLSQANDLCVGDHSGMLCGGCRENLSIVFGTTDCRLCSDLWLLTVLLYATAGVVLVVMLFALQLTVSSGIINGLIFYTNVVGINARFFLGHSNLDFLLVFISFINLELGFPLCFYDGMTETVKTGLQFVFPVYLWAIVIAIIIASRYSMKIAKWTARSSVPVLATLIHLSFSKLLNTVVNILTYSTIKVGTPDSTMIQKSTVWYFDGNVTYLTGGHIALFILAILTLLLFIAPYTIVLLGVPFFMRYKLVNYFKPLIDSYQGPYKDKWRLWFGARLCVLEAMYIIYSGLRGLDIGLMLLLHSFVLLGFLFLQIHIKPFRNALINALDTFFMVNYVVLAISGAYLYPENESLSLCIAAGILVGIAFLAFWGIIFYRGFFLFHMNDCIRKLLERKAEMDSHKDYLIVPEDHTPGPPVYGVSIARTRSELTRSHELREPVLEYQCEHNI